MRQTIGTVLDWTFVKGYRSAEAPMRSLSKGLPRQPNKHGQFAAMSYTDLPAFMQRLRERESIGRLDLGAVILAAARSGEVSSRVGRKSIWAEFCSPRSSASTSGDIGSEPNMMVA